MQPSLFSTRSLQDMRIMRVLHAAIESVDPFRLTASSLTESPLPPHRRLFILGMGKAADAMGRAAIHELPHYTAALLVTKQRTDLPLPERTHVLEAGHPVPDERSLQAGRAVLDFVRPLQADDLLLCLLSGGASALVAAPVEGVSLEDLQDLTSGALTSGASIDELNTVRRKLDRIKGGGLLQVTGAPIRCLILSDVLGDRLPSIASGPTAPDPTTAVEALAVLERHGIRASRAIRSALSSAQNPPQAVGNDRVRNLIIGNNTVARASAVHRARDEGFEARELGIDIVGEARDAGRRLGAVLLDSLHSGSGRRCIVAGGETTVTMSAAGKGGRNQELALASVEILSSAERCMLISLATDGNDGPTDAAGAVVTGATAARGTALGMAAADYLERHDSYMYFAALDDLLRPGYTGTNVNDLMLLFTL